MKQSRDVQAFKNELRNYTFYQERVKALESLLDICYDALGGVRGVDPSREPTHSLPNKDYEYRIRDEISRHEANRDRTLAKIKDIDELLGLMDSSLRMAVIRVYANGEKLDKVARGMYLTYNGLFVRLNREIERVLNEKDK